MNVVLDCYRAKNNQVKQFAPYLRGRTIKETCNNVWQFVKDNIAYKVDPPGEQWIKEPARVWADKVCDCKSYSVFIASLLHHLGIEGYFRFVSFAADHIPTHVYVVVPIKNGDIKIDCVLGLFNKEKPFTHKYDYSMTRISQLSGIGNSSNGVNTFIRLKQLLAQRAAEAKANGGWIPGERQSAYQKAVNDLYASGIGSTNIANFISTTGVENLVPFSSLISTGMAVAPQLLQSMFSKQGVSPSFFETFSFLKFLDNSTGQWKSRLGTLKKMTPDQRACWYIDLINSQGKFHDAVQYHEMFYNMTDQIDDRGKVSYVPAMALNGLILYKFFDGDKNKTVMDGPFPHTGAQLTIDVSRCPDYATAVQEKQSYEQWLSQQSTPDVTPASTTPVINFPPTTTDDQGTIDSYMTRYDSDNASQTLNSSSSNNMLLIGAAVLAAILLIKK